MQDAWFWNRKGTFLISNRSPTSEHFGWSIYRLWCIKSCSNRSPASEHFCSSIYRLRCVKSCSKPLLIPNIRLERLISTYLTTMKMILMRQVLLQITPYPWIHMERLISRYQLILMTTNLMMTMIKYLMTTRRWGARGWGRWDTFLRPCGDQMSMTR